MQGAVEHKGYPYTLMRNSLPFINDMEVDRKNNAENVKPAQDVSLISWAPLDSEMEKYCCHSKAGQWMAGNNGVHFV